jgi:hypothetical protein
MTQAKPREWYCMAYFHDGPDERATVEFFELVSETWFPLCESCRAMVMGLTGISDEWRWRAIPPCKTE